MENCEDISLEEVSLKAKPKREIYNLFVTLGTFIYLLSKTVIINF